MSEQSLAAADIVSVFIYTRRDARAECTCGYEGRRRRFRGGAVMDALVHAASKGCRENWPLVYDETPPRRGPAAAAIGWLSAACLILGLAVAFSAPAKADAVDDYVSWAYPVICTDIAQKPYISTVESVVEAVKQDSGQSYYFAGQVVGAAVRDYCPWNRSTLERYIAKWLPTGPVAPAHFEGDGA